MPKDKNLAIEYLNRKIKIEPFNSLTKNFKFTFFANDIIEAFNAGCESVIENISELKWEEIQLFGDRGRYVNVCRAHKPLDDFLIRSWNIPKDIELLSNNFTKGGFKTVEEAKSYAAKVYKERVKEVLEL